MTENHGSYVYKTAGLPKIIILGAYMHFKPHSKKLLTLLAFTLLTNQEINAEIVQDSYTIQNYADDAEEYVSGYMSLYSSDLEIGGIDRNRKQIVGLRYQNITIPENATITGLYLQFNTDEKSPSSLVDIQMETGDNNPFRYTSHNISSRQYTDTSVNWNVPAIEQINQQNEKYRTPNLISLMKESEGKGWNISKGFVFKISGDGKAGSTMDSRESGQNIAPKLTVVYDTDYHGSENTVSDPSLITDIYVNEVSAKGTKSIKSDWIELYNDHNFTVLLDEDFYLSNKKKSLDKFQLHNISISAKSYVTLFADDKEELGNLHTNFKLKSKGGKVYLSKEEDGEISKMDTLEYGKTLYNETYGRLPDATDNVIKFRESGSAAHSNQMGTQDINLNVDKGRGIYPDGVAITFSTSQDSTIMYTTDGSFPSKSHGEIYTSPIDIVQNTVIKAIAYNNHGKSKYVTNTYIIGKNDSELKYANLLDNSEYLSALKEIPIISISKNNNRFKGTEELTTFEFIDTNATHNDKGVAIESGVKKFGAWSYHYRKNNLRFYFRKDYGYDELSYDVFKGYKNTTHPAVDDFKRLELKIGEDGVLNNDFSFGYSRFSDKLMHDAMLDMGHLDVHAKFVHVFLNGKYYGVETLRERYDDDFAESYLTGDDDDYVRINNKDGYWHYGYIKEPQHRAQWNNVKSDVRARNYQAVKNKVHMEDYIKMMLMYLSTDIEYEARGIMNTKNTGERIRFSLNDADGLLWGRNGWSNWTHWGGLFSGPGYIFGSFTNSKNLEFMTTVKDDVAQYFDQNNGVMSTQYFTNKINTLSKSIDSSYKLDVSRWGFRKDLYTLWKKETNRIISDLPSRFKSTYSRLKEKGLTHTLSKVVISKENNRLTVNNTNPNTEVYYTVDGSDPMGNDGTISNTAIKYNNNILLEDNNGLITARTYQKNNWGHKTIFQY